MRRAQYDRVRFWTPQRHPPIHLRSRVRPPPPPPRDFTLDLVPYSGILHFPWLHKYYKWGINWLFNYINPYCTGLFCTLKILGGGASEAPLQILVPKGPIAVKFGTHLTNCAKRKTMVLFLCLRTEGAGGIMFPGCRPSVVVQISVRISVRIFSFTR